LPEYATEVQSATGLEPLASGATLVHSGHAPPWMGTVASSLSESEKLNARRYQGVSSCDGRYLLLAAKDGNVSRVLTSMRSINPLQARDMYSDTPLHHAAVRGHCEVCSVLIRCEPMIVNAVNRGKNTALHLAASSGELQAVKLLLAAGANMNAIGIESFTPLHYACRDAGTPRRGVPSQHALIVKTLVEASANPEMLTEDGMLPSDLASSDEVRSLLPARALAPTKIEYETRLAQIIGNGNADNWRLRRCGSSTNSSMSSSPVSPVEYDAVVEELPAEMLCPVTQAPLVDPVTTSDGHTYERYAISSWLELHDTSPLTGLPLETKRFTPNVAMREAVTKELQRVATNHVRPVSA